jgi:hypothetical protein
VAIECYRMDNGRVPRMAHASFYRGVLSDFEDGVPLIGLPSNAFSTPIAYLPFARTTDPFMTRVGDVAKNEAYYTYHDMIAYNVYEPESLFWPEALQYYGDWRMVSVGPDETYGHGFRNSAQLPYDPTNGSMSLGNIWLGQKESISLPPIPELLGDH